VGAWTSDQLTWSKSGCLECGWLQEQLVERVEVMKQAGVVGSSTGRAFVERGHSCRAKKVVTVVRMTSPKVSALGSASGAQCPTWRRETEEKVELQVKVSLAVECFLETNV
jgi:hypothetical protein